MWENLLVNLLEHSVLDKNFEIKTYSFKKLRYTPKLLSYLSFSSVQLFFWSGFYHFAFVKVTFNFNGLVLYLSKNNRINDVFAQEIFSVSEDKDQNVKNLNSDSTKKNYSMSKKIFIQYGRCINLFEAHSSVVWKF